MPKGAALPKIDGDAGLRRRRSASKATAWRTASPWPSHFAAETGAVYVPPFDDREVIAGQGTVGLELAEEAPEAEVVVVPVGGGGLLSGVAAAYALATAGRIGTGGRMARAAAPGRSASRPPAPRPSAGRWPPGRPVTLERVATMADGIAVATCSELTLAHAQAYVDEVVTVDEEEISQAMLLLLERAKAVVEPSGAARPGRHPGRAGPRARAGRGGAVGRQHRPAPAHQADRARPVGGRPLPDPAHRDDRPGRRPGRPDRPSWPGWASTCSTSSTTAAGGTWPWPRWRCW